MNIYKHTLFHTQYILTHAYIHTYGSMALYTHTQSHMHTSQTHTDTYTLNEMSKVFQDKK